MLSELTSFTQAVMKLELETILKENRNPLSRRKLTKTVRADLRAQLKEIDSIGREIRDR